MTNAGEKKYEIARARCEVPVRQPAMDVVRLGEPGGAIALALLRTAAAASALVIVGGATSPSKAPASGIVESCDT